MNLKLLNIRNGKKLAKELFEEQTLNGRRVTAGDLDNGYQRDVLIRILLKYIIVEVIEKDDDDWRKDPDYNVDFDEVYEILLDWIYKVDATWIRDLRALVINDYGTFSYEWGCVYKERRNEFGKSHQIIDFEELVEEIYTYVIDGYLDYSDIGDVTIYKEELDVINNSDLDTRLKKRLFALLVWNKVVYQKYGNTHIKKKLFVPIITEMANVKVLESKEAFLNLHDFEKLKLVEATEKLYTRVTFMVEEGTPAIILKENELVDCGITYMLYIGKEKRKLKRCERCGKYFEVKSNRQKYCEPCKEITTKEQARLRKRKQRSKEINEG